MRRPWLLCATPRVRAVARGLSFAIVAALVGCGVDTAPLFPSFADVGGRDAVDSSDATTEVDDAAPDVQDTSDVAAADAPDSDAGSTTGDTATGEDTVDTGADVVDPDPDVVIATFNVARFFDTVCDSNDCGAGGYEVVPSDAQFAYRARQIAAAIEQLDADVVLLQEVESDACMQALVEELGDSAAVSVLGETGGAASLDVAVLARAPLELLRVERHADVTLHRPDGSRTSFAREFLEVHLAAPAGRVIVFAAHFKSKSSDDPGRRFAEAEAAASIVEGVAAANPEAVVVLGGDLNDAPGSDPIDAIEADGSLQRFAAVLPAGEDWTHVFNSTRSALDHLYLATSAAGTVAPASVRVVRDASGTLGGSDHAALRGGVWFE
ncbi:MAG: endonuclease/exonuclease/phosphatase family protein [Myxococcales bacterium]|nr:endonuclease/exonuclease/phosphatase family protein [Myxococcales bacterium]MCB9520685.1 endonuclease/exonuclease/phosphatase family protein [Myxococcales bacterium]